MQNGMARAGGAGCCSSQGGGRTWGCAAVRPRRGQGGLKVLPCGSWSGCDAAEEVLGLAVVTRGLRLVRLPVTMTQRKPRWPLCKATTL